MKTNAGYTLVEILVTIGILSIISGVAYVSYQDQTLRANKNNLKTHAELFASSVKNCISINGGWSVDVLNTAGEPGGKIQPCNTHDNDLEKEKKNIKSKLDFTCPEEANCETHTHGNPSRGPRYKYHCLSIKKTVSGTYLQVLSRVSYNNPSKYQIWCKEGEASSDLVNLEDGTCKEGTGWSGKNLKTSEGFKKDNDCWK